MTDTISELAEGAKDAPFKPKRKPGRLQALASPAWNRTPPAPRAEAEKRAAFGGGRS